MISDTHDNVPNVARAVERFNREGVSAVLHCGDFVAPFALLPFEGLECGKFYAVFGNNDGEKKGLSALALRNGWTLGDGPLEIELGGRKIAILHEPDRVETLSAKGGLDAILYGHMHRTNVEMRNGVLVVNPGEAGGWITGKASVALLDLSALKAEIVSIV